VCLVPGKGGHALTASFPPGSFRNLPGRVSVPYPGLFAEISEIKAGGKQEAADRRQLVELVAEAVAAVVRAAREVTDERQNGTEQTH